MTAPEIEEKVRREVDDNPALSAGDQDEGAEGHDDAHAGEDAGGDGEGSNETRMRTYLLMRLRCLTVPARVVAIPRQRFL